MAHQSDLSKFTFRGFNRWQIALTAGVMFLMSYAWEQLDFSSNQMNDWQNTVTSLLDFMFWGTGPLCLFNVLLALSIWHRSILKDLYKNMLFEHFSNDVSSWIFGLLWLASGCLLMFSLSGDIKTIKSLGYFVFLFWLLSLTTCIAHVTYAALIFILRLIRSTKQPAETA